VERIMTLDESEQVETLLLEWHRWQASYFPALSSGRCDATCRGFQISKQLMSPAERSAEADAKIWKMNSEQVDLCVDGLQWEYRAAIQISMKNKRAGAVVWGNARIPKEDAHRMYQEAKEILLPLFFGRGLIKPELVLDREF
jgi:hypothetical protein